MKPQCKFETSAKGQSRRTNRLFSSFDRVAAVRAATTPDKFPEKAHFYRVPFDWSGSLPRQKSCLATDKNGEKFIVAFWCSNTCNDGFLFLAFDGPDISNPWFEMAKTNLFSVLYLCRTFFQPHRRFRYAFVCVHSSICSHTSDHWSLRTCSMTTAHTRRRGPATPPSSVLSDKRCRTWQQSFFFSRN